MILSILQKRMPRPLGHFQGWFFDVYNGREPWQSSNLFITIQSTVY